MDPLSETPAAMEFGRFRVLPHRRELLADSRPIHLGGRAFDVLMALIEASGAVVSKDALIERVWPNQVVEENNLHVQISTLRNAFAADRGLIRTIAGRGYQFTGVIRTVSANSQAQAVAGTAVVLEPASARPSTNLPEPVSELIGRAVAFEEILGLTASRRLVTLTGAGGIGKTRLGLEVARRLLPKFVDGVWVVELAGLSDPDLVPVRIATALHLELAADAVSPERIANALGARRLMLLLDDCEHVLDPAARMSEALLRFTPAVRVIATSREPLQAEGEHIYRVPPLDVPAEGIQDADDPLHYGAVQLFVARVRAAQPHFSPDRRVAAATAAICRRLDGIPLAIELAASRAAALGIEELATRLNDRFHLLTGGRRTALPRHQTLRATLDWSYELLAEPERVVLRRLAIFSGGFKLEAASAVAAGAEIAASDVVAGVANLVTKSLVSAKGDDTTAGYRLLETTRAYALEKLVESGELEAVARRHAEYYRHLFECAETEWETRNTSEWLATYAPEIDNLRVALDWAFSPGGDAAIGVALTVAATPLWFQLSLINECRGRVERALAALEPGSSRGERCEMQLYAALGWSLMYTTGPERETEAWRTALVLAERLDDTDYQLRALWGLWAGRVNNGEFRETLALARQFRSLAARAPDPADALIGDRMIGASLHFLGDQAGARQHIERVLKGYVTPTRRSDAVRFRFDQRVTARITLARALWLQGFADQAMRDVESNIEHALSINHTLSLCNALALAACPIALLAGELSAAERFIAMLLDHAERHALDVWHAHGRCFEGDLLRQRGDVDDGLQLLRVAIDELREARFVQYHTAFLRALAQGFAAAGRVAPGLAAIDEALARSEHNEERWSIAEELRVKGELLRQQAAPDAAAAAEEHFVRSLDWARRQGALSWELRAATSLARLWHEQGRTTDARALLMPVYDRFTEGFDTADLKAARALSGDLG